MTDNKLTDEQIIKALECCKDKNCTTCPCYDDDIECGEMLIGHTIDFINRQKPEKEALINGQETLQKHIAELKAEIERLQAEIESLNKAYPCTVKMNEHCLVYARSLDDYDKLIGEISSEGIKEFAEKLKEKSKNGLMFWVTVDEIDNTLEEMEGKQ